MFKAMPGALMGLRVIQQYHNFHIIMIQEHPSFEYCIQCVSYMQNFLVRGFVIISIVHFQSSYLATTSVSLFQHASAPQ